MLQFNDAGLIPGVIQHVETGQVLMLGWMNAESVRLTLETGDVWFYSRSRQELWHKGATSGDFFRVREVLTDCDEDVVLVKVLPDGAACHTGAPSCFFNTVDAARVPATHDNACQPVRDEMTVTSDTRTERDSMGPMDVPIDAYYGASTMRAVLNFPISDLRLPRRFLRALGQIKQAAAQVNAELGLLDPALADAISRAASEVIDGRLDAHFVVDVFQTGSGTSTNMNANEVIANRAGELLGAARGERRIHPNDHVNVCQSSNDVIPTAIHLSALSAIVDDLIPALQRLAADLRAKSEEFWPVVKTGRTHLQDATPIRLGQEFLGYAGQIERGIRRLRHAQEELSEVALGGTAVGTGVNSHPEFAARVTAKLAEMNGFTVRESENHFQAQSTLDGVIEASGAVRTVAISLMKIANDIRWLGSGPRAGIGELALPEVQPGSSIMPGKVNPVIAESVIQVGAQVLGNDLTVSLAGQWGNFELNTMMPVAAYNLLQSVALLAAAADNFSGQLVQGLRATEHGPAMVERGLMVGTALAPVIGYEAAADIAKTAAKTGRTIREVAREKTNLTDEELNTILDPAAMTEPGLTGAPAGG